MQKKPTLIVVAAALIDADRRVLLQRRAPGRAMAGLWEFPGGKLEAGETPRPGSQVGRFASEPEGGVTSLGQWVADAIGGMRLLTTRLLSPQSPIYRVSCFAQGGRHHVRVQVHRDAQLRVPQNLHHHPRRHPLRQ